MTLRKKSRTWLNQESTEDNKDDLLVFGYSCKLFRDDERAAYIDRGKHLIPWMGQESHMIDRYDGRGYLNDLEQYESAVGSDPWNDVSDEESYMEKACDEERYMFLSKDLTDQELYHEEEIKRLRAALADDGTYNQVGFSYDDQGQLEFEVEGHRPPMPSAEVEEIEEEFVPAPELNIPEGMEMPSTSKINAIVEKTAMFVSKQGAQMEIVIKAKQSKNPQFAFMAFDHPLYPYYKHMVQAIKSGKFTPSARTNGSKESDDDDDDDDDHYLHPSLLSSRHVDDGVLFVPKVNYIRTGEDSYSKLVSQLRDKVMMDSMANPPGPPPPQHISTAVPTSIPPPPGIVPVLLPRVPAYGLMANISNGYSPTHGIPLLPPADLVPIIDKMASYVAKNGKDFEVVVQNKGLDQRFEFIKPGSVYNPYYQQQLQLAYEAESASRVSEEGDSQPEKEGKASGVVSFSIKMVTKDTGDKRNAFTPADSEDEDGGRKIGETDLSERRETTAEDAETDDQELRTKAVVLEAKQAEQKIMDKLAAAARERLSQVSREKQLQMERKRKAAMFLTLLHRDDDNLIGPRLPTPAEMESIVNGEGELPQLATATMNNVAPRSHSVSTRGTVAVAPSSHSVPGTFEGSPIVLRGASASSSSPTSSAASSPAPVIVGSYTKSVTSPSRGRSSRRSRSRSPRSRHSSNATWRDSSSRDRRKRRRNSGGRKHKKRSRSRSRRRSSSHSPVGRKSDRKDKRKSSRTPPAAYALYRNSASPKRSSDMSRSKPKSHKRSRSSRSPSRHKDDRHRPKRSTSPTKKRRS